MTGTLLALAGLVAGDLPPDGGATATARHALSGQWVGLCYYELSRKCTVGARLSGSGIEANKLGPFPTMPIYRVTWADRQRLRVVWWEQDWDMEFHKCSGYGLYRVSNGRLILCLPLRSGQEVSDLGETDHTVYLVLRKAPAR